MLGSRGRDRTKARVSRTQHDDVCGEAPEIGPIDVDRGDGPRQRQQRVGHVVPRSKVPGLLRGHGQEENRTFRSLEKLAE